MNNKQLNIQIIDTAGQWTPVVFGDYSNTDQAIIGRNLLTKYSKAGQVAFIDSLNKVRMMGGELSINGSLAAGYAITKKLAKESILLQLVEPKVNLRIKRQNGQVTAFFNQNIIYNYNSNSVTFKGIAYQLIRRIPIDRRVTKAELKILRRLSLTQPAAGLVYYSGKQIWPVVYVNNTKTITWETACGSGSLAYYLVTGISEVVQPSNQIIRITDSNGTLSVSVRAKEILQ